MIHDFIAAVVFGLAIGSAWAVFEYIAGLIK